MKLEETICAPATAVGRASVGIIRISGTKVREIAKALIGCIPKPRHAHFSDFKDSSDHIIDKGLALFFPAPNSFTGEDILELQGHGGVVVMDLLLKRVLSLGARFAKPGEFSLRAFLNDKMDLAQAEAIADLIDAGSKEAARAAMRSLEGVFSALIHQLVEKLINLRMYIEASLDFPEEEIDFLSEGHVEEKLKEIYLELEQLQIQAKQGAILRDGMTIVIAGAPNAGKSSLLNQLCGRESAIVTDIPGTTRDLLREHIQIDGLPLQIIDTAGLRESNDPVELEGMRRAHEAISKADRVLYLIDVTSPSKEVHSELLNHPKLTYIYNKIDLSRDKPAIIEQGSIPSIYLSAKTGNGIELLKHYLKSCVGFEASGETLFSARRRHLDAAFRANENVKKGFEILSRDRAGELLAEELRLAQEHLNEITGEFSSDDLLGRIFGSFCIGK